LQGALRLKNGTLVLSVCGILCRKLTAETIYLFMLTDLIRMGITGKSVSAVREDEYT